MRKGRRHNVFGLMIPLAVLLSLEPIASASTVTGRIVDLKVNSGITPARVSILMQNATSCGNQGWYAFEAASDGVGKLWFEALLTAINAGHQVTITGTGTCDAFAVEGVNTIEFK